MNENNLINAQRDTKKIQADNIFEIMKKFLITYADDIQKAATEHHKEYIGGEKFRSENNEKYQKNHIEIVKELAKNLNTKDLKKGTDVFKSLGERLAKDSVNDKLTLEEAVDGIIFLKQAVWQKMELRGLLDLFSVRDLHQINLTIGTYCDVIAAKIAFSYHNYYIERIENEKNIAEKALKTRDNFISAASHELKTPVTSIKIYMEGIKRKLEKEGDKTNGEYFEKVDNQIHKLTLLVEDLLSVSKLENGKLQLNKSAFDINDLIKESVDAIQNISSDHKIIFFRKSTKKVFGDRYRMYQVLTNLLTNAIKYSPRADKVIINLLPRKDSVVVKVEDFGIGIDPDEQKEIFNSFYRVTGKEERTFPGMGMGLFIANQIVKGHGGEITVKSKKGKGSEFSFSLPYAVNN
jgi:signal transduction histidine kinase